MSATTTTPVVTTTASVSTNTTMDLGASTAKAFLGSSDFMAGWNAVSAHLDSPEYKAYEEARKAQLTAHYAAKLFK